MTIILVCSLLIVVLIVNFCYSKQDKESQEYTDAEFSEFSVGCLNPETYKHGGMQQLNRNIERILSENVEKGWKLRGGIKYYDKETDNPFAEFTMRRIIL